jgi:hypothetical protein
VPPIWSVPFEPPAVALRFVNHVASRIAICIVKELAWWSYDRRGRLFNTSKPRTKVNGIDACNIASEGAKSAIYARFSVVLNHNGVHCQALHVRKDHIRQVDLPMSGGYVSDIRWRITANDQNVAIRNFESTVLDSNRSALVNDAKGRSLSTMDLQPGKIGWEPHSPVHLLCC